MVRFEFISAGHKSNIEGVAILKDGGHFIEEKYDGSRFGVETCDKSFYSVLSRGGIDRVDNIPYIIKQLRDMGMPPNSVLDCEAIVFHEDRKLRWELARSVMGTKVYNPNVQEASLLIFDVQWWDGVDVRDLSYSKRREIVVNFVENNGEVKTFDTYKGFNYIFYPRRWSIEHYKWLWDLVVEEGKGEGIMLKSDDAPSYGKSWTKVKKEDTVDAFILSATKGKGKYQGMIGTIELAVYNNGVVYPIGKVSNIGEDSERRHMTDLAVKGELKHKVLEVKFNEVTKNFKLRHGRFMRWRPEKAMEECLLDQLKDL